MGWVMLALVGGTAFALLIVLRLPRLLWSFAGAALMLGAAGYALQGRPATPARPTVATTSAEADDPGLIDLRGRMLGLYGAEAAYQVAADAMTRAGDRKAAVQVLLGGIRTAPRSVMLWTSLGSAMAAHDGQVSPASLFAFRHAGRLAPDHPAPPFFLGLAYVRAGEFEKVRPLWRRALALSPAGASYREDIAVRLVMLDRYLAEMGKR
jgi:Flp pilus assembly protein TadD